MTNQIKRLFFIIMTTLTLLSLFVYILATKTFIGKEIGRFISDYFIVFKYYDGIETSYVDWQKFKILIISIIIISIVFTFLISYLISVFAVNRNKKDIAKIIDNSFSDNQLEIPNEYLDIKNELDKLKIINQKNEQAFIQETQKTKDLITYLAHDLRTPLASVIGYLNLVIDNPELSPDMREKYLNIALEKSNRLEFLIDELFDITRFNFYDMSLNYHTFDLSLFFEQLSDEFYPIFDAKNQTLELSLPATCPITGDSSKLARVFNNIFKNSSTYGKENSVITVDLIENTEDVTIKIANESEYIPSNDLNHIFKKFYRVDSSRSSQSGGAGLGLAIAKEIIEAHHGNISVASDNHIITFTVTLPKKAKELT